jgi:IS4 transposase
MASDVRSSMVTWRESLALLVKRLDPSHKQLRTRSWPVNPISISFSIHLDERRTGSMGWRTSTKVHKEHHFAALSWKGYPGPSLGCLILVVEERNGPFLHRIVLRHQGIPLVLANLEGNASTVG